MCLSTPTVTETNSDGNSAVTSSCNIVNQTTTTACANETNISSNLKITTTQLDCNGNATTTLNSITQRKTKTQKSEKCPNSIEDDSMGLEEENAVYKEYTKDQKEKIEKEQQQLEEEEYKPKLRYPDLGAQLFLHLGALYGFYLLFNAKLFTFLWLCATIFISGIGITAGAHRLWSHKTYSASLPLRILLIFLFTIAGQRDAYTWALDHRIHHKFSETEADPHNAKRGFWFSHVGWLFLTAHPKVAEKRRVIDMSDLENDKVVMFQKKWYIPLFALISIGLPVVVPWHYWNETLWNSFWIAFTLRFTCTLNAAFFVNSVAHLWGSKPYDKNISPVESPLVSFMALGEGWHNYHHVFPWDYKTGEFNSYRLNVTTAFIDFCSKIGLATGRKFVSPDMIKRRALKCGDGSRFLSDEFAHKDSVWGFGDRDIPQEDLQELTNMKT